MAENIIIHGDSIKKLMKMAPNSVDLIFADPPYWMRTEGELTRVEGTRFNGCDDSWDKFNSLKEYESFTREWLSSCRRVLKPNGSIWVIGSIGRGVLHTSGLYAPGFRLLSRFHGPGVYAVYGRGQRAG